jgi:cytochrome c peroxidase
VAGRHKARFFLNAVFAGFFIAACAPFAAASAEPVLPTPPYRYADPGLPAHAAGLAAIDSEPADNPVTDAGATLGRVLFHDRDLSRNGLVSCASCHTQATGFDDQTRFSIGFAGRITRRSAMALANARYNPSGRHFRDERAATLEIQVLDPFVDRIEMGLRPGELVERIEARAFYGPLFSAAFGDAGVDEERVAKALAQFVRAMTSFSAPYDRERALAPDAIADFPGFSASENRGKFLFLTPADEGGAGCASCHETEAFVLLRPRGNGLPADPDRPDEGLAEATGNPADNGHFRAASLRNIAVTPPYMRDGRFQTLEEVIDHYDRGVADVAGLDPLLRDAGGGLRRLDLSQEDRDALVAFLRTLTDMQFLEDPRFSDPFGGG